MPLQVTITRTTMGRILLGVLIGAAVGGLVWLGILAFGGNGAFGGRVDPNRWQAVFLSNGEVYYGHLVEAGSDFYELRDAYFVVEGPAVQKGSPPTQQVRPITQQFQNPEQSMLIAKQFVIKVENLSPDSQVVKAIDRLQGGGP
jgi:hypothetical protein